MKEYFEIKSVNAFEKGAIYRNYDCESKISPAPIEKFSLISLVKSFLLLE